MEVLLKWWYPTSSILIGLSMINQPFWWSPIYVNLHIRPLISVVLMASGPTQTSTQPPLGKSWSESRTPMVRGGVLHLVCFHFCRKKTRKQSMWKLFQLHLYYVLLCYIPIIRSCSILFVGYTDGLFGREINQDFPKQHSLSRNMREDLVHLQSFLQW